jgi:hypothetical protein
MDAVHGRRLSALCRWLDDLDIAAAAAGDQGCDDVGADLDL